MKAKFLIFIFLLSFLLPSSLAGSFWFDEGSTIYVQVGEETYNITMLDISVSEELCGLNINNQTFWLKTDSSQRIDGLLITVFEAVRVHSELKENDLCKVVISGKIIEKADKKISDINKTDMNFTINETIERKENISNISEEIAEKEEKISFFEKILNWLKKFF